MLIDSIRTMRFAHRIQVIRPNVHPGKVKIKFCPNCGSALARSHQRAQGLKADYPTGWRVLPKCYWLPSSLVKITELIFSDAPNT